jgi:hypothetical protein
MSMRVTLRKNPIELTQAKGSDLIKDLFNEEKLSKPVFLNTIKRARFSPLTLLGNEMEMTSGRILDALSVTRNAKLSSHSSWNNELRKRANSDRFLDQLCLPRILV